MTFPHLSVALILIVLCFALLEASVSEKKMWLAALGGVCGLVLGFIHAVNLIVIYAGVASFALISLIFLKETRPVRSAIVFGAFSVWPVAYYLYLILARPELLPRVAVRSPAPLAYLIGFAPFVILSLVHVASLIRTRMLPRGDLLLLCWAVTNSLMLYSYPLLLQEGRAVLGLQMPLVVLSSRAVFGTVLPLLGLDWERDTQSSKKIPGVVVATLIIGFTFPSTLYNISERVSRLKRYPEAFSLTRDEYDALNFLRGRPEEGVVLSGDWIGNYVPRVTHKPSWLGQYDLPSHDLRLGLARRFFAEETPDSSRLDFLKEHDIGFVYHGQDERALGGFDPKGARYLKRIFQGGSVSVYRFEFADPTDEEMHSL